MSRRSLAPNTIDQRQAGWWLLLVAMIMTTAVYSSGLAGGYLFDDYPNIVDNPGVQPHNASIPSLVRAALSSPSSEFKRPLASLSFAANYLASDLDPYWMKLTNLIIHLLNGLLVFLLARTLVGVEALKRLASPAGSDSARDSMVAALIAAGWMLLPINLTGVLYVVQRMESMANLFVLLGLLGYVAGRRRILEIPLVPCSTPPLARRRGVVWGRSPTSTRSYIFCVFSLIVCTGAGLLAKETAVMLPLYALLIEWLIFGFSTQAGRRDYLLIGLFVVVLLLPMVLGLAWLLPGVFNPEVWATRDFTLGTRLLSEARIVVDYIVWTLLPTPDALSFYHDNFLISSSLLTPWTTLASIMFLGALIALLISLRQRRPLAALGIALFLSCQLLTGTILPLELIYEHRNYFASFGLLLTVVSLLAAPSNEDGLPMALQRYVLLAGLMLCWTTLTAFTAYAWGNPLRLAEDLASRAPKSPRAQYELGRTYIIYSNYDLASPFTRLAYTPLERSAALPGSSILAEQALIFMNSRMHLPLKDAWWAGMIAKLKEHKPGVQDESSLGALTQCVRERHCDLPADRMVELFTAALAHPDPSARLLATYGDYAWNVLDDHKLGERMTKEAVKASPGEPAYQITLIRMLAAQGHDVEAELALRKLTALNIGGRLDQDLSILRALPGLR
jgi:protein O-mannosyl-transferase